MNTTKHTTNRQIIKHSILIGALSFAATFCFATASNSAERPFSFHDAEYYIDDHDAIASANAFVSNQLPPGLSRADAVERLTRAGMDCGRPKSPDALTCTFADSVADRWTVRLTLDSQAEVTKATVELENFDWARN
jgi:hypothetical protein